MPLFDYECSDCKIVAERLVKHKDSNNQYCISCKNIMRKLASTPAKTPGLWNDNWNVGLSGSGKYDAGLGMRIYSEKQRDRELSARGLIRESDLGASFVERKISAAVEETAAIDAKAAEYKENLIKFEGNKELAVSETWTAKDCLDGKYDSKEI